MSRNRDSKLLETHVAGKGVGTSVLLIRGVHALSGETARKAITDLETEVRGHPYPKDVKSSVNMPKTWAETLAEWEGNPTGVHISVMPDRWPGVTDFSISGSV